MLSKKLLLFKRIFRNLIFFIIKKIYWLNFLKFIKKIDNQSELIIFDLDNTLANTFPYLKNNNLKEVYSQLPVHTGMIRIFKDCILSKKNVIILSARSFRYHSITRNWIDSNLPGIKKPPLFLVPLAEDKLPYLIKALHQTNKITYYDDLSYNHENGQVKFYNSLIDYIKKTPINYIGFNEIKIINNIKNNYD